nr:MAG TPA: hypothetical protein [Caudoviricetes sp.]
MHTLPSEAGAVLHLQGVILHGVTLGSLIVASFLDLLVVSLVVVGSERLGIRLDNAKDVDLHWVRQSGGIQKVRLRDQVGHILDVAQLRQSGCAVATIQGGIQTGDSSTHRMFTSLVSVNHSVLSDCCPIAAINPIDGIVIQPIQRGKRFAIKFKRFHYKVYRIYNRPCFCNTPCLFVGINADSQGHSSIFCTTGRVNVSGEVTVFLNLHTRKLFDVAIINFACDKDSGELRSERFCDFRIKKIETVNQLLQTSLHVAST